MVEKELLALKLDNLDMLAAVITHSLKTTILSWCAKHGMPLETRRILGHHLDQDAKITLTYSRDALTAAHQEVAKMPTKVRSRIFSPR